MSFLSKQLRSVKKAVTHPRAWAGNAIKTAVPLAGLALGGLGGGIAKAVTGGGGLGGVLRSVGGWASKNPDLLLGGASMLQGAMQQGKADKYNQQALDLAKQPWEETKGLRAVSLDRMMNPKRPDLSSIYAGSSNPFSR